MSSITSGSWVEWSAQGRDPYHNPRARRSHMVSGWNGYDAMTECGVYVDGDQAHIVVSGAPRCQRCEAAAAKRKAHEDTETTYTCASLSGWWHAEVAA